MQSLFDQPTEDLIFRFERSLRTGDAFDVTAELEGISEELRGKAMAEIACIDLEHGFASLSQQRGAVSRLVKQFPEIFREGDLRSEVAKEHLRLCRVHGIATPRSEIARRYRVDASDWQEVPLSTRFPAALEASAAVDFPRVHSSFCGYPLFAELGRGALARVYLARQPDLAQRWVVLKVTSQLTAEAQRMASLQHEGIVPVFSIHQEGALYGICMPYLGPITLANLMRDGRLFGNASRVTQDNISTLVSHRLTTILSSTQEVSASRKRSAEETSAQPLQEAAAGQDLTPSQANQASFQGEFDGTYLAEQLELSELAFSLEQRYLKQDGVAAKIELMTGIVESVAHAHRRGIIHRDIKPENILIANDGRPVLLDFNLASSVDADTRLTGGTIPYMSPQQLRSIETGEAAAPADDVYALGVLFYQLLTGEFPFATQQSESWDLLELARERSHLPKSVRTRDSKIAPSLSNIIEKCLQPSRDRRYASAAELLEDLECYSQHRSLKHAPDHSWPEKARRFVRRNPVVASNGFLATSAAALVILLATALWLVRKDALRLGVQSEFRALQAELPETLGLLQSPLGEPELSKAGIARAEELLQSWGIEDIQGPPSSKISLLSKEQRDELGRSFQRLLLGLSEAEMKSTKLSPVPAQRIKRAEYWREFAQHGVLGRMSTEVHREESRSVGRSDSLRDPSLELYAQILDAQAQGKPWQDYADQLVKLRPRDTNAWFTLASAHYAVGDFTEAGAEYDVALKLAPKSVVAGFWRGVARLKGGDPRSAIADFTRAISTHPNWLAPRYNRALAYRAGGQLGKAIEDLSWIEDTGRANTRVFSLLSQLHTSRKQLELAKSYRQRALGLEPVSADDWIARGVLNIPNDPQLALEDLAQAQRLEPSNLAALQNIAHIQAEILVDLPAALDAMDKLVARTHSASSLASRGILLARSGQYSRAKMDAEEAAKKQPAALEMLQIAGIYAMCTKQADCGTCEEQAMQWLAKSLALNPGYRQLARNDPDLANLRSSPVFEMLTTTKTTFEK